MTGSYRLSIHRLFALPVRGASVPTSRRNHPASALHRSLRGLVALLIAAIATGVLIEIGVRLLAVRLGVASGSADQSAEHIFWQEDARLGWSIVPDSEGIYSNGLFRGEVHNDAQGVRRNSPDGTRLANAREIFAIGDSTTAALEVDDAETAPAVLERRLRARGERVNVRNLGVRGYGTDQAVERAIGLAGQFHPTDIVYLFTNNDLGDNQMLRNRGRKFGKGAWLRRDPAGSFEHYRAAAHSDRGNYVGTILLDDDCVPHVHEARWDPPVPRETTLTRLRASLRARFFAYRAFEPILNPPRSGGPPPALVDPWDAVHRKGVVWDELSGLAFHEGGVVRRRCAAYLEDQMRFLLARLHSLLPRPRVFVAQFPDASLLADMDPAAASGSGSPFPTESLFASLLEDGTIDGHLVLSRALLRSRHRYADFACPGDPHFCADGNAWIAREIDDAFFAGVRR